MESTIPTELVIDLKVIATSTSSADPWPRPSLAPQLEAEHPNVTFRPASGFLPFARAHKTSDFIKLRPPKWFKLINRSSMSTLTQMCTNHAPTGEYFKRHVWKYQNKPPSFFFCPCHKSKEHNYPPVLQTREHIIRACPLFEDAREKLALAFPGIRMPQRSLGRLIKKKHVEHTLDFLKSGAFSRRHAPYEPP